jgi:hypothetical protein
VTAREVLARKLARANADLAPEDECLAQARHTAALREDPTYVGRWLAHEAAAGR